MKPSARGAAGQADVQEVAGGLRGRRRGANGRGQDTEAGQGAAVRCEAAVMAGEWDGGGGSLGLLSRTSATEPPHLAAGKTRTRKVRLEVKKRPLVSTPFVVTQLFVFCMRWPSAVQRHLFHAARCDSFATWPIKSLIFM